MKARINRDSLRYQEWLKVFGTDEVPILSPAPVNGSAPDPAAAQFYKLDTKKLTLEQRKRLALHLAHKWKMSIVDVYHSMDDPEHGVPILATDVTVALDMRLFT